MSSLVGRTELRRLEKAARDKDKRKLGEWLAHFEMQLDTMIRAEYEKAYQNEIANTVDNTLTAVAYSLYFSEENYIDKSNIADFMADMLVSLDMFRTGEYRPEDYEKALQEEKVTLDKYDCDEIYKKYLNILDNDLVRFLKHRSRKIIAICGNIKNLDVINEKQQDFAVQGQITLVCTNIEKTIDDQIVFNEEKKQLLNLNKDMILLSDILYIVNKNNEMDEYLNELVKFAEEHNKTIEYMEQGDINEK